MEHKITPQQISNEAITPQGVTLVTAKRQKLLYGAYAHTHARERFSEFINRCISSPNPSNKEKKVDGKDVRLRDYCYLCTNCIIHFSKINSL